MTYRDGKFEILHSETIRPGDGGTDEGRRRYAELFLASDGPNHGLQSTGDRE